MDLNVDKYITSNTPKVKGAVIPQKSIGLTGTTLAVYEEMIKYNWKATRVVKDFIEGELYTAFKEAKAEGKLTLKLVDNTKE